ncbi:hypothetical protein RvY_03479 [Ramazzottius varieornatus]|uniref:Uncharacterized protein n=1 Tax=Ramazzottius varieornatus TaxID=947166 RepID=A0A1D1UP03_RAMVA|nr:hypothetical protein RvY_03479 [Ramazzottius varieornatus]
MLPVTKTHNHQEVTYGNGYASDYLQLAERLGEKEAPDGNGILKANSPAVLDKRKPVLRASDVSGAVAAAREAVSPRSGAGESWFRYNPDVLITFITGNTSYGQWRRDDYRSALQGGFIKLINTLRLGIFDDGLYYGLSRMWGDVVREEEIQRRALGEPVGRLPLIGVVPSSRYNEADTEYPHDVPVSIGSANAPPPKFPLDGYHPLYAMMESQSYKESSLLRVAFEREVQEELNRRATSGRREEGRKFVGVPMVAFLFQGELDDLDRIRAYLEAKVPIVIMEGCGGLGNILSSAIHESAELDGPGLRTSVGTQLQRAFPFLREDEYSMVDCLNSVMEVLKLGFPDQQGPLLSIMNCRQMENFGDLQSFVLKSVIGSSSTKATPDLFEHFLSLAVKCNNHTVALNMLLNKAPWSDMELPESVFELALLLPNREMFVDIYLQHLFRTRKYVSDVKLLKLFREAKDRQFFPEHVWEGIMRYSIVEPVGPDFITSGLNWLIKELTGVRNYIDAYGLTAAAYGQTEDFNNATEEKKAMNALIVHAVLFNRPKMVKTLIKHHAEPLPQALFAESLFHGLYKRVSNAATGVGLKNIANDLAKVAVDIFDKGVQKSGQRGPVILTQRFPDFNDKTPLELAYDTNNKGFVAHGSVQGWLDQYYSNFIRVKGNYDSLKLFLSAVLVFPMYIWLSFPLLRQPTTAPIDDPAKEGVLRPRTEEDINRVLAKVKRYQTGGADAENTTMSQQRPPLGQMIHAVWSAPVVRFYAWHLFYWMFIILICVDIMLPPCRFIGVDIAVFVITISIWSDIVTRTLYDQRHYRKIFWVERSYDLISQTLFNILFFLYRIAPYRYDHPFAGRVILAFGILYYCYRVWSFFYYMEKTFGPVIRIVGQMFCDDLARWLVLLAPFMIATTLIFQGVITPDWPLTGDDWRHAWYRGVFTIFAGFPNELEYTPGCERQRTKGLSAPWRHTDRSGRADGIPPERCWTGEYDDYSCPTVSFWSYFFVIQYYVLLKLGLSNLLSAFYVYRQLQQAAQANLVWKYHRARVVMDYANRTSMPPPFYALGYIYRLIFERKTPRLGSGLTNKGVSREAIEWDTYTFWKGVALDYFRGKEQEAEAPKVPQQQVKTLTEIQADLALLAKKLTAADRKMMDVEEYTRQTGRTAQDAAQMKSNRLRSVSEVAQPYPHKQSRASPYPATAISRLYVPDDRVDWQDSLDDYRPEVYNKAAGEFSGEESPWVDSESDLRSVSGRSRGRRCWITTQDGQAVSYNVDSNGNPLNPFGRTGLRGRGGMPRFGPNHKVYLLITNSSAAGFRYIVQRTPTSDATLPQRFLGHHESEYAVACLLLDAFLYDTTTLNETDLDVEDVTSMPMMSDTMMDILRGRLAKIMENFGAQALTLGELYRGYLDSALNTDNAWMEVVVFHLTVPSFGIDRFTTYKWKLYGSDTLPQDFEGAIVRQAYQQSSEA